MFRKPDMERHEKGCTRNPARECYLCQNNCASAQDLHALAEALKKEYGDEYQYITDEDLKRIRDAAADCPACILSVIQQAKIYAWEKFNYKKELAEWHKEETINKYGSLIREF